MASLTPGGAIVSFGGVTISSLSGVTDFGFGPMKSQPVKALEMVLGSKTPVDLFNGQPAPRTTIYTPTVFIRVLDSVTDPAVAWAAVMAGFRALDGLPETGTLVVKNDAASSSTVSCQARRDPLDLDITPQNPRHMVVPMVFTLLSDWA